MRAAWGEQRIRYPIMHITGIVYYLCVKTQNYVKMGNHRFSYLITKIPSTHDLQKVMASTGTTMNTDESKRDYLTNFSSIESIAETIVVVD